MGVSEGIHVAGTRQWGETRVETTSQCKEATVSVCMEDAKQAWEDASPSKLDRTKLRCIAQARWMHLHTRKRTERGIAIR